MKALAAALALLVATALAPPAVAQVPPDEAATRADLRCVIVVAIFAAQTRDNDMKVGSAAGLGFFMGRLKGRVPGIDLKARLLTEAGLIKRATDLDADFARCGAEMQAFGKESTDIGAALSAFAGRQGVGT